MYSVHCNSSAILPVSPEKIKSPWSVCTVRKQMHSDNNLLSSNKSTLISIKLGEEGGGCVSLLRKKF